MDDKKLALLKKKFAALGLQAAAGQAARPQEPEKPAGKAAFSLPGDWQQQSDFVYTRVIRQESPLFPGLLSASPLLPAAVCPEELLFFDVETTGLSGGAGNLIFLIGLGTLRGSTFTIEQIFLADFPGEAEFLELLARRLLPERFYVSYNGKGFDAHVLQARFLLNGRQVAFPRHLDLLYPARRLWKPAIGSCTLGEIETRVLGVKRSGDVPGFLVPEIYFAFLKSGQTEELLKVFYHNYVDILSLARLLQHMLGLFDGTRKDPLACGAAAGEYLLKQGRPEGVSLLEQSFTGGSLQAGRRLSLYHKHRQNWNQAVEIWQALYAQAASYFAAVELAKYYEHRLRQYAQALAWVEKIAGSGLPLQTGERQELARRRERLLRRLAGQGS